MERGKLFAQSRVFSLPPCFPLCRLPEAEGFLPGRAIQSEGTQFRKGVSSLSEGVCKKRHREDGAGCGGPWGVNDRRLEIFLAPRALFSTLGLK